MLHKSVKIIVNILMLIALIFSYRRFYGDPTLHVIAGSVCSLLFGIHFYLNRKTFKAYVKGFKKLNFKTKLKYLTDLLLLLVWGVTIISGVFALCYYLGIIEIAFDIKRLHGIFSRVGGVLIVIHIVQHGRQIILYFKKKNKNHIGK